MQTGFDVPRRHKLDISSENSEVMALMSIPIGKGSWSYLGMNHLPQSPAAETFPGLKKCDEQNGLLHLLLSKRPFYFYY